MLTDTVATLPREPRGLSDEPDDGAEATWPRVDGVPRRRRRGDRVKFKFNSHAESDIFPISKFRKPGVRLVALHIY